MGRPKLNREMSENDQLEQNVDESLESTEIQLENVQNEEEKEEEVLVVAPKKKETTKSKVVDSPYPFYEKWEVSVKPIPNKSGFYEFTAIEMKRECVKIEEHIADELNTQSHNNGERYYLKGTITFGNKEVFQQN